MMHQQCASMVEMINSRSAVSSRSSIAIIGVVLSALMTGCSILPGTFIVTSKPPTVVEDPVDADATNYDFVKVTPTIVRKLREETLDAVPETQFKKLPAATSHPYRLGRQDVLRIFVWGNPDLTPVTTTMSTTSVASTPGGRTIDDDGNIFFPLAGTVRAEGLSVTQFRRELTKRLSRYIKDPQVEVDVAAFRSQKVFISGQVRTPGVLPITDQPMRLTDAIGLAGGATDNSDLYGVVLTRGKTSVTINADRLYYNGDTTFNVLMQDGDVLSVPDRSLRKVFVLGEVGIQSGVNQARSYIMRRGDMTLTEVLSDAGGTNPFSSAANEVYVMRFDREGKPVIYILDALQPASLLIAEQFPIKPRDIIFVNPTGPTMIGRFIGQFLPFFQGVNAAATTPF